MFKQKLYPWFEQTYKKIIMYYKLNKIKNTLFIYNFNKIGCDNLFKKIIIWLICKNKTYTNCGFCYDCNLMLTFNHPDFIIINNQNKQKKIDINYINKIIDYINIKSQEFSIKIIYFPKIELLNKSAIFQLLKLLKQKKKKIFFLIKCNKLSNLILNIKKNCFYLNLNLPNIYISLNWLKKKHNINITEIKTALSLSNFSPLLAHKILSSIIWSERQKLYNLIFNVLFNKNIIYLFEILEFKNLKQYIYWIYILLIDIIKFKKKCAYYILNIDKIKIIENLSNLISLKDLFFFIKKLNILQYKIKTIKNINIKILLIEQILFFAEIINFNVNKKN